MDFIMNNYLWFGIIGIILLMALIGFLAEKTNFITGGTNKPKKEKKKKNDMVEDKPLVDVVEEMSYMPEEDNSIAKELVNNSFNEDILIEDSVSDNQDNIEILEVANNDSVEPAISDAPIAEDVWSVATEPEVATVTDSGEDLTVPIEDITLKQEEQTPIVDNANTIIEEDDDIWKF